MVLFFATSKSFAFQSAFFCALMVSVPDLGTPELHGNGRTHSWLLPRNPEVEDLSKSSISKVSLAQERRTMGFSCSGIKPGDKRQEYEKIEKT